MKKLIALLALSLFTLSSHAAGDKDRLGFILNEVKPSLIVPDFSLDDMDEVKVDFSEYKGKVVLLNFWATWCPPCRREMPSMERVYKKYQDKDFSVVAINQMEDADEVFTFTAALDTRPTFDILLDINNEISSMFNVRGLPTTYLIDKKGRIRYRAIGGREFDHPKVEKIIQALMDEE